MDSQEKNILRESSHLSETDLIGEIQDEVRKFMVLTKSEEAATRILAKYGKEVHFDFNVWKKFKYNKLMISAKFLNLDVPNEWYNVEIDEEDIIQRIREVMNDEINLMTSNFYISNCSKQNIAFFNENDQEYILLSPDIEIDKIIVFYNDIIAKEFGNRKKLVK